MTLAKFGSVLALSVIAAGMTACGQESSPGSRPAAEAREITRASSETFGDYIVHFNAQSTTMLPVDVARAFGIQRGSNRAMLNIAVLRRSDANGEHAVGAAVDVQATNLLGQLKDMRMRELREGEAIYYIGELRVANEEIINFNISVRPVDSDAPHQFRFQQQFYTD
ncbi:MAG: DUF4426 domain-containing protein [Gammaproteobacteria bacterium]